MTAARTEAVEFKSVGADGKSVSGGYFFLEPLNFFVFKFHDLLAAGADEVIVVALVRHVVVFRLRTEMPSLCEAGIAEQIECPVDGREPQMRIGFRQLVIHGFRGNVLLTEEGIQNQFTLPGELELMLAQVFFQRLHFFHMCSRQDGPPIGLIKDETCLSGQGGVARNGIDMKELTEIFGAAYSAPLKKDGRMEKFSACGNPIRLRSTELCCSMFCISPSLTGCSAM